MDAEQPGGQNETAPTFLPQATSSPEWQARLLATLDALPDLLFVMDRNGRILDFHAPNRIGLFLPPERFLGRNAAELLPGSAGYVVRQAIAEALETGHHQGGTYALDMPNGHRWFELSIAAHGDLKSDDARLVAIARDVTERKQAEDALRESERTYRMLTEGMKDVTWVLDVEARRFTYVSPSVEKLRGYTPAEILARPLEDAWIPEQRAELEEFTRKSVAAFLSGQMTSDDYATYEMLQPCKDGSRVASEVVARLVRNPRTGRLEAHGVTRDVSARKRAEQALRESESRLDELARQSRTIVFEMDADGRCTFVNPVVADVLGYRPEELVGKWRFFELFAPEDRETYRAAAEEFFRRKAPMVDFENPCLTKDGRRVWVSTTAFPVIDSAGRLQGYRGSVRDVTERKRAETALRESEERFAQVTRQSRAFVWEVDADGLYMFVTPVVEDVLGYRPDELAGRLHFYDLHPAEGRDEFRAAAFAAMERREKFRDYENPMAAKDGRVMWVSTNAVPLLDKDGALLGYRGVDFDVTARKLAEDALRESEESRRIINDRVPDGMVFQMDTGPDGQTRRYSYVSAGARKLHGLAPAELMADAGLMYRQMLPEDAGRVAALEQRAFETMTPFRAETRFRLPSGEIRWRSIMSAPRRLPNGHLVWDGIEIDVTERKLAEEALKTSEARYRGLIDFAVDGILLGSPDGVITDANACMCALAGRTRRELVGKHVADLFAPETLDAAPLRFDLLGQGETVTRVRKLVRPDASEVFVEMHSKRMSDGTYQSIFHDITQRKRAEEALRLSEAKYRQLHETMRDAFATVDMRGRLQESNAAFRKLTGYSAAELKNITYQRLTPRKWRAAEAKIVKEQVLTRGYSDVYEKEYRRKDGTVVPVELRTILIRDAAGKATGMWASIRDVTERKLAEKALRESESKYRRLYAGMRDAFVIADMQGRLVDCNPAFEALIGYRREEILRLHYADLTPARWGPTDARAVKRVLRFGYSDVTAKEYIRKDGTLVPVEMTGTLIRDASGKPAGIAAFIRDISERQRAESALRQAHDELERRVRERTAELETSRAALAQSEEQFRQMAENAKDAFWLIDAKTLRVLYVSPAFARIWNRPIAGNATRWFDHVHPDDRAHVLRAFRSGLRTGIPATVTYRLIWPDGSIRWIESSGSMIRDARNRPSRAAGLIRDVTDQRRLEAEILQAAETERQRIGRDLHDSLGQSLTAIGYLADAVREDLSRAKRPEAADVRKLGRLIGQTAAEAHALARGLLLADLKRGGLGAALQELAFRTRELFGVACRYAGPASAPPLDAQTAGQLYRIAQEAIANAAKHGHAKRIDVRLAKERQGLLLSVRDNGRGLPARKKAGAGLGLDIMRYRAGLIGATLWIDSQPRRGTTVNCLLPRAAPTRNKKP